MTMIITLAEAKHQSRIDNSAEDAFITADIEAASAAILTYVGDGAYVDPDAVPLVFRDDVKTACKILVAMYYRYRTGDNPDKIADQFGYGYMPHSVTSMLFPYRKLVAV